VEAVGCSSVKVISGFTILVNVKPLHIHTHTHTHTKAETNTLITCTHTQKNCRERRKLRQGGEKFLTTHTHMTSYQNTQYKHTHTHASITLTKYKNTLAFIRT